MRAAEAAIDVWHSGPGQILCIAVWTKPGLKCPARSGQHPSRSSCEIENSTRHAHDSDLPFRAEGNTSAIRLRHPWRGTYFKEKQLSNHQGAHPERPNQ